MFWDTEEKKCTWTEKIDLWALGAILYECVQSEILMPETLETMTPESQAKILWIDAEKRFKKVPLKLLRRLNQIYHWHSYDCQAVIDCVRHERR